MMATKRKARKPVRAREPQAVRPKNLPSAFGNELVGPTGWGKDRVESLGLRPLETIGEFASTLLQWGQSCDGATALAAQADAAKESAGQGWWRGEGRDEHDALGKASVEMSATASAHDYLLRSAPGYQLIRRKCIADYGAFTADTVERLAAALASEHNHSPDAEFTSMKLADVAALLANKVKAEKTERFAKMDASVDQVFVSWCSDYGIDPAKLIHVKYNGVEAWRVEAQRLGLASFCDGDGETADSATRRLSMKLWRAVTDGSDDAVAALVSRLERETGVDCALGGEWAAWLISRFAATHKWEPDKVAAIEIADLAALLPSGDLDERGIAATDAKWIQTTKGELRSMFGIKSLNTMAARIRDGKIRVTQIDTQNILVHPDDWATAVATKQARDAKRNSQLVATSPNIS